MQSVSLAKLASRIELTTTALYRYVDSKDTLVGDQEFPDWLSGAIADRFPRLSKELRRDWTDVEAELARAVETVLSQT